MSRTDLLRFALNVTMRYKLSFFFKVNYFPETVFIFERKYPRIGDEQRPCRDICYSVALSRVNAHLRTNYTSDELAAFELQLTEVDVWVDLNEVTAEELSGAFGGLDVAQVEAVFKEFFTNKISLKTTFPVSKERLLSDIRFLWDVSKQPLSLCYMLTAVTLHTMNALQVDSVLHSPTPRSWQICNLHASRSV
ncbi:hypothetical protein V5799_025130 [Amblyomma americanum]|uniref:Uncharacterized protein n=1 Tax=Amblyomma americanum TaxID=6943 RepID=A0AAQ4EA63_AMBAM